MIMSAFSQAFNFCLTLSDFMMLLQIQRDPAFKKPLFINESEPVSYTIRAFLCEWCQFLINFSSIRLCIGK